MRALANLYNPLADLAERLAPATLPTLARFTFAATLLGYFWASALTKTGDGLLGVFQPSLGAYAQIFPKAMEAASYDVGQLGMFHWAVVVAGRSSAATARAFVVVVRLVTCVLVNLEWYLEGGAGRQGQSEGCHGGTRHHRDGAEGGLAAVRRCDPHPKLAGNRHVAEKEGTALAEDRFQPGNAFVLAHLPRRARGGPGLAGFGPGHRLEGALANMPTAKEQGYDVIGANWRGFYLAKDISDEEYAYWGDAMKKLVASEQFKLLREQNGLAEFSRSGAEMDSFVRTQVESLKKIFARMEVNK